jgi:hypothetical protein
VAEARPKIIPLHLVHVDFACPLTAMIILQNFSSIMQLNFPATAQSKRILHIEITTLLICRVLFKYIFKYNLKCNHIFFLIVINVQKSFSFARELKKRFSGLVRQETAIFSMISRRNFHD